MLLGLEIFAHQDTWIFPALNSSGTIVEGLSESRKVCGSGSATEGIIHVVRWLAPHSESSRSSTSRFLLNMNICSLLLITHYEPLVDENSTWFHHLGER